MEDYFTMMMLLNMDANQDFDGVREELHQIGRTLGVKSAFKIKRFLIPCTNYRRHYGDKSNT